MAHGSILNQTAGNSLLLDGSKAMEANLDMGNHSIINLAASTSNASAVRRDQLTAANTIYSNSSTSSIITSTNVQGAIDQLFTSVSNGKELIADAITDKGVTTSASASFQTMANNIGRIAVSEFYRTSISRQDSLWMSSEDTSVTINVNVGRDINSSNYLGTICILSSFSGPSSGRESMSFTNPALLGFSCWRTSTSSSSYSGSLMVLSKSYGTSNPVNLNTDTKVSSVAFSGNQVRITYEEGLSLGDVYWGPYAYGVTNPEDYRYTYTVISWGS